MGRCEYIDDSASFLDGYHCLITGRRVDDPQIVGYYCKSSVACEYCPYRGGDDRYRKPKEEPPKRTPSYDTEESYTGGTGSGSTGSGSTGGSGGGGGRSSGYGGKGLGVLGGLALLFVGVGVLIVFITRWLGLDDSRLQLELLSETPTKIEDVSLRAICLGEKHRYKSETGGFDENAVSDLSLENGINEVYLEYDGTSILVGAFVGDDTNAYTGQLDLDKAMSNAVRILLVTLEDGDEVPITAGQLRVTDERGEDMAIMAMDGGGYVVLVPNDTLSADLTFSIGGYEPLSVKVDMSERVTGVLLTLAKTQETDGR